MVADDSPPSLSPWHRVAAPSGYGAEACGRALPPAIPTIATSMLTQSTHSPHAIKQRLRDQMRLLREIRRNSDARGLRRCWRTEIHGIPPGEWTFPKLPPKSTLLISFVN